MSSSPQFDFWYALQHTTLLRGPQQQLETFGTTRVQYHLISELMDSVDQVRVREGILHAARPQILTPGHLASSDMEGFEDQESENFLSWLRQHQPDLRFLHYGFSLSKQDIKDTVLTESVGVVQENVLKEVEGKNNGISAVLMGVEQPWEVCLMKLMVELVEKSAPGHVQEMQQRNLLPNPNQGSLEIESEFDAAARDRSRLPYLQKRLRELGVFEQFQDRFFQLVRTNG
jgi:hypothetical protein